MDCDMWREYETNVAGVYLSRLQAIETAKRHATNKRMDIVHDGSSSDLWNMEYVDSNHKMLIIIFDIEVGKTYLIDNKEMSEAC